MEAAIISIVPKHLIEDRPIVVYPTLAKILGINKAVILQQLHFLLGSNQAAKNRYNFVDGRWWVYNTYKQWKDDHFPWLGESTIKKLMTELERDGLVLSIQSVKNPSDRRKWYTIDYEKWNAKLDAISSKLADPSAKNEPMVTTAKNEPINNGSKLADGYTDSTTNTTIKDSATEVAEKPKRKKRQAKEPTTVQETDSDKERNKAIASIIQARLDQIRYVGPKDKPFKNKTDREHAGALHDAGLTPHDVQAFISECQGNKYKPDAPSMTWISEHIGTWHARRQIEQGIPSPSRVEDNDNYTPPEITNPLIQQLVQKAIDGATATFKGEPVDKDKSA